MDDQLAPVYDLNTRRISPAALLRPNDLLVRTRRRAATSAILRDARIQVATGSGGDLRLAILRHDAA